MADNSQEEFDTDLSGQFIKKSYYLGLCFYY